MSKVAFRSRQLDFHKPVPIYWTDELAELSDPSVVTRAIPYIPSGMEKEEETEQHLQWALSSQEKLGTTADCVIPIPEVQELTKDEYEEFYKRDFKLSKHLIRIQTFGCESEFPDYDLDVEDEKWLAENGSAFNLTPLLFESMIDRLEKGCGQQVLQLAEAKALLKEDDDLTTMVYNYWLNKRSKLHHPLILHVKTDKRDVSSQHDPYVAFRRRAEKMQTRKNRKSDEISYERMCKLKRDCGRLVSLLELIRRREKSKKELIQLAREIFGKRYEMQDFDGRATMEAEAERIKERRLAFMPQNQQAKVKDHHHASAKEFRPQKRQLEQKASQENRQKAADSKRRRAEMAGQNGFLGGAIPDDVALSHLKMISKAEQMAEAPPPPVVEPLLPVIPRQLMPPQPEGRFAFKRMAGAVYLAPHPLRARLQPPVGLPNDPAVRERLHASHHGSKSRFSLTSIRTDAPSDNPQLNPLRSDEDEEENRSSSCMLGFARLRRGRGARFVIDRAPVNRFMTALTRIGADWASQDERSASGAGRLARLYRDYVAEKQIPLFSQHKDHPHHQPPPRPPTTTTASLLSFSSPLHPSSTVAHRHHHPHPATVTPAVPRSLEPTGPLASLLAVSNGPSSNASSSPCGTLRPNTPHNMAPCGPPAASLVQQLTILTANHKLHPQPSAVENGSALTPKNHHALVFPTPMVTLLSPTPPTTSTTPLNHHQPQQQSAQQVVSQVSSSATIVTTPQPVALHQNHLEKSTPPQPLSSTTASVNSPPLASHLFNSSSSPSILAQQQQKFYSIATHQASIVTNTNGTGSQSASPATTTSTTNTATGSTTPGQQQVKQARLPTMVMMDAS